jgi:hypothetical protein
LWLKSPYENRKKDIDFPTLSFYPAEQSETAKTSSELEVPPKKRRVSDKLQPERLIF